MYEKLKMNFKILNYDSSNCNCFNSVLDWLLKIENLNFPPISTCVAIWQRQKNI